MSFEAQEISRFLGRPVRLFVFQRQALVWRYCRGQLDLDVLGDTYLAAAIDRSEVQQTTEREKDKLTITMPYLRDLTAGPLPATQALGNNWHPYIPSDPISVTCLATHHGSVDPPVVEWTGIVVQPEFSDTELKLICEPGPAIARARNQGPKWQRACWKTVYSVGLRGCNLSAAPIPIAATLTGVAGSDVTAPEFADPPRPLVGGTMVWETAGPVQHTANIIAHAADTLTLDDTTGLVVGSDVTANTIALWVDATLATADGVVVTAPEFADPLLALDGGWLDWTRPDGLVERRSIMGQDATALTLLYGAESLAPGLAVRATPGCPGNWAACEARGNTVHYGGSVYKPVRDPTQGSMSWG